MCFKRLFILLILSIPVDFEVSWKTYAFQIGTS